MKIATHSKTKLYPSLPPAPVPLQEDGEGTTDEAASDPPSPQEVEKEKNEAEEDQNQTRAGDDVEIEGMDEMLRQEEAENQALKRQMEEATVHESKGS